MKMGFRTEMPKKIFILANPRASTYHDEILCEKLAALSSEIHAQAELYRFKSEAETRERLQKALDEDFDYFLAAGGDGTVSMLANLIRGKRPIGILPAGTGNVLARILNIPLDLEEALKLACGRVWTRTLDGLEINGRLYLMTASVGFSARLIRDIDSVGKSRLGILIYALTGLRGAFKNHSINFRVGIDGQESPVRAVELMVVNTGPWGMARYKLPNSRLDDGKLEVYDIQRGTFGDLLDAFLDIVLRERKVILHCLGQGQKITIDSRYELPVQADGDIIGHTPIEIKVVPGAASFIVPPG
jgi:diacylglycerol kinase (ATP)